MRVGKEALSTLTNGTDGELRILYRLDLLSTARLIEHPEQQSLASSAFSEKG